VTTFRPSARVKLTIRTEEFSEVDGLESRLPPGTAPGTGVPWAPPPPEAAPHASSEGATTTDTVEALSRNQERRRALQRRRGELSADDYDRQLRAIDEEWEDIYRGNVANAGGDDHPPEAVTGAVDDDLTVVGYVEPRSVSIERNGLASADTATLVIDFLDAPIDPRIVRSAHVEIVIGVVPADDYEAGLERGETRDDGSLRSLVAPAIEGTVPRGATRFLGYVDEWDVSYSEQGDTITIECRDMSAPLRDLPLPAGLSIDLSLPLDEGVSAFLETASATTRGVTVSYRGAGDPPTPADSMPASRRARRGSVARRARRGGSSMSLWDHITDVCRGVGLLPVVDGFDVVLLDPRTLVVSEGIRRMVYGRNLQRLEFSRRLQGSKVPTIEVRCYDPDIGRVIWARFPVRSGERRSGVLGRDNPPRALRANEVTPSGANPDDTIKTLIVSGITDPALLERIAESAFDQIGRQEIEGTLATLDAWSYDRTPDLADLLDLDPGDSVEVLVAAASGEESEAEGTTTSLARLTAMERARRASYLEALGWPRAVAQRFAALQDATGFQTVFRVQDVRLDFDAQLGLKIEAGFVNYIEVREDEAGS